MEKPRQIRQLYVYFELTQHEEDYPSNSEIALTQEWAAYEEAQKWLRLAKIGEVYLGNEGHDGNTGALLCKFTIDSNHLENLYKRIKTRRNGDGNAVCLYAPGKFQMENFEVIENPGTEQAIPFDDWEDYIENHDDCKTHLPLTTFKITFTDGTSYKTNCAAGITIEEATKYFSAPQTEEDPITGVEKVRYVASVEQIK